MAEIASNTSEPKTFAVAEVIGLVTSQKVSRGDTNDDFLTGSWKDIENAVSSHGSTVFNAT